MIQILELKAAAFTHLHMLAETCHMRTPDKKTFTASEIVEKLVEDELVRLGIWESDELPF